MPKSLLLFAMDHGIDALRASDAPLIPFVAIEEDGVSRLHTFEGDNLAESIAGATRYVRTECRGERVVLVYDGSLAVGDDRLEAIYAESVEIDGRVTVVAQRYKRRRFARRFQVIGNPVELAVKGVL